MHPNHFQILLLKKYLAMSMTGTLSFAEIEEKIDLQQQFIDIYEVVDPGLTKWKGKILFVVCKLKMFLIDQQVVKCLELEPEGTVEHKITAESKKYHTQANEILQMTKMLG